MTDFTKEYMDGSLTSLGLKKKMLSKIVFQYYTSLQSDVNFDEILATILES